MLHDSYFVYILTNHRHTTLYVGMTSDIIRRMQEHRSKLFPRSFTARYNVDQLVYIEAYADPEAATTREHQIKAGSRQKKLQLIRQLNPQWIDINPDDIETWLEGI